MWILKCGYETRMLFTIVSCNHLVLLFSYLECVTPTLVFPLHHNKVTSQEPEKKIIKHRRFMYNKKVLLRERKRRTARRVASPLWGGGIPTLATGYLPWPGRGYLPWPGYPPPPGVDRQTPVKVVPPPILRMWAGKNVFWEILWHPVCRRKQEQDSIPEEGFGGVGRWWQQLKLPRINWDTFLYWNLM